MKPPRRKYPVYPFDAGDPNAQGGGTPVSPPSPFGRPGATSREPLYVLNLDPALLPVLEEDPDQRPYLWDLPEWEIDECL